MSTLEHTILDDKYRLVRKLETGGMGSVWLAEHLSLHSPVAVKLIAKEVAETEEGLQRFLREARTAASLRSPHVVQILDYGVDQGTPYIVMELLDGESLANRLERVERLSPAETELIIRHVSRAVGRAHDAGIVHRDLKPANIFIIANDDEEVVKLLDFGIAKAPRDAFSTSLVSNTRTGAFLGTPFYVSPEQAEGTRNIDHRSDIWSMGVIAFECLVGAPPFKGETFGSLVLSICSRPLPVPSRHGAVAPGFDAWFARACARDVDERFQSAREAALELKLALGPAASVRSVERPGSTTSRPVAKDAAVPRGAESPAAAEQPAAALGLTTAAISSAAATERTGPSRRTRRIVTAVIAAAIGSASVFLVRRGLEPKPNGGGRASATSSASAALAAPVVATPSSPPASLAASNPSPELHQAAAESAPRPVVAPVLQAVASETSSPVERPSALSARPNAASAKTPQREKKAATRAEARAMVTYTGRHIPARSTSPATPAASTVGAPASAAQPQAAPNTARRAEPSADPVPASPVNAQPAPLPPTPVPAKPKPPANSNVDLGI